MSNDGKFEQWCLIELYGHTKLAGFVTEQSIGGQSFVRVDVPATTKQAGFTKLQGQGSIYSLQPVTEEIAKGLAEKFQVTPLGVWDLPDEVREALAAGRKLLAAGVPPPPPTEQFDASQYDDDYEPVPRDAEDDL